MSKHCILINGTMGVGKTTVCKELMQLLPASVFLDGDWCWYSHPFTVTEQTKQVVFYDCFFRCTEQRTSCAVIADGITGKINLWCPCQVFNAEVSLFV